MAKKVYIDNNYLILEFGANRTYSGSANMVIVREMNTTPGEESVAFYNVPGLTPHEVSIADLVDETDTPYTVESFKTFYRANTGKGVNGREITFSDYQKLTEEEKTNGTTYFII